MQPKPSQRKAAPVQKNKGVKAGSKTVSPLPPMQRKALSKVEHCRAELAAVYRQARAGRLDIGAASRLANILAILSRMIEGTEIEKQLDEVLSRLDRIEGAKP
jgi:hypothetical protein